MAKNGNQLRIISGKFGGRIIDAPKTAKTHPMGDRERSAIFNRLRAEVSGAIVLDAFAGSGALGIEALSLGADSVDFIESNPKAIQTIKANLTKLKLTDKAKVIRKPTHEYDIVFADPPYNNPQYDYVEELTKSLKTGGILVLSHPESPAPFDFKGMSIFSDRSYAAAHIKMYQKQ
jgi:16S rRNA (guanine966-N2)-methyltransferase